MNDANPPDEKREREPSDDHRSEPADLSSDRSVPFAPPKEPCECYCLHCQRIFMSDQIWLQRIINSHVGFDGHWLCPTPNCDGVGFTFDIFPTDPNHPDSGWVDDDDYADSESDDEDAEYDPDEPAYAQLDELYDDEEDDDLEGEEWKLGLAPGERPPEPPWASEARERWERHQRQYDEPDQRPRIIDMTIVPKPPPPPRGENDEIGESDIPF